MQWSDGEVGFKSVKNRALAIESQLRKCEQQLSSGIDPKLMMKGYV